MPWVTFAKTMFECSSTASVLLSSVSIDLDSCSVAVTSSRGSAILSPAPTTYGTVTAIISSSCGELLFTDS
jgi:hypothetical protein